MPRSHAGDAPHGNAVGVGDKGLDGAVCQFRVFPWGKTVPHVGFHLRDVAGIMRVNPAGEPYEVVHLAFAGYFFYRYFLHKTAQKYDETPVPQSAARRLGKYVTDLMFFGIAQTESGEMPGAVRSRTLRQVLKYSPQSTLAPCARHNPSFPKLLAGGAHYVCLQMAAGSGRGGVDTRRNLFRRGVWGEDVKKACPFAGARLDGVV